MNPIFHAFRDCVELKEVAPYFVPTARMPADILIKALDRHKVNNCIQHLGLGSA